MPERKTAMSATNDKDIPSDAAIIVFGTARGAKLPQAGWFRAKDKDAATAFSLKSGLSILNVDSEAIRKIIPDLREAQLRPGSDPVIPVIDTVLLQRLEAVQREAVKQAAGLNVPVLGGSSAAKRPPPARSLWNALKVGDLVLAADLDRKGTPEGWFEAVITAVDGDTFLARFRDYPEEGTVKRLQHHIALLYPQG